ncbi:hypothetical protein ACROYT_G031264 [Oculina patagonica]
MEAKCSFSAIVGDSCTYERRDKAKKTEVIPLLYCTREIAGHKSTWGISDVETEVDLILARAAVFTFPENIGQFTICTYHRSSSGTGWRRGSQRCQVPEKLSGHSEDRRWPKAERGLGKRGAKMIHRRTGVFVAVGSGVCRNCRILLSKLDCEAKSTTESREALAEELSDKTEVLVPMENLTISGPRSQAPVAASTPFQLHRDDIEKDASESILSIQLDASYDDTWNLTENVSTSTVVNAPNSLALLNTFLESRDVSPIRYTLRTPWDEASERTKRQHVHKAREAVSAVLSEVAPEEPSQLWHALSESQETKRLFKVDAERRSATTDDSLLEALATCYNNADQWDTRRQILSIMADKASFAKIQEWIPGLTRYRFMVARQHILLHGRGAPVPPPSSRTRMVVPEDKLAHFLDFITSPHIIQDLPFGEKVVTLSTKEVIKIPNVVRNMIPERIVQQYQAYFKESGFTPMSRSTLLRILEVCPASTRKSLQGIDYISSAGAEAFDILGGVADRLGEMNMGMSWAKEQKEHLKKCKRYLKTDYKVHVSASSNVADHCRVYALNDPKDRDYQSQCSHEHNTSCDNCDDLTKTMDEIEAAIEKLASSDVKEELCFVMRKARKDIVNWKAHLLRSVNQEEARLSQLDALDSTSIVLVQDWAMKFLPRKFRESQTDWYAKRGISWHITVAIRRGDDQSLQMMTFVNVFRSCNQDGCTVLSVMSDVLRQVKEAQPQVKKTYYWQDNAGCYHCGTTIVGAKLISQQHDVSIKRLDFCDSQAGKGACDRKAAGIKSHMKIYLNSGNNIESAEEMKDAILSAGGLPSVNVTVSGPPEPETFSAIMLEGVSAISNIEYTDEGLIVWRAYKIGPGKLIQWDNLDFQSNTELPGLSAVDSVTNGQKANFTTIQSKKPKIPSKQSDTPAPSDSPSSDESSSDESNVSLFSCPEEGCIKRYQRFSSLQRHLDCGKHHRAIENESLLDRAITGYSERLEVQSGIVPNIPTEVPKPRPTGSVSLPMGWALRSSQVKRTRFNTSQRNYLTKKFDLGETSGRKEDPDAVARAMMTARDSEGNRLFTSAEFLTSKQIASFFSRLAAKRRRQDVADVSDEEVDNAERESALQELTNTVMQEVSLEHPIVYDCYNLCELVRSSKLSSFAIQMLKEICNHFEIDTSHIKVKRKKQYVDLLVSFSKNCSCQK